MHESNTETPPPPQEAVAAAPTPAPSPKRKLDPVLKKRLLIGLGAVAAVALAFWVVDLFTHEETDDAYVTGHIHYVSSRIAGVVADVAVDDNQEVKEGQILVKLDPRDYQAIMADSQSAFTKAKADFTRNDILLKTNAVSQGEWDQAKAALDSAEARLGLAVLQVQYCTITAPASGRVGRKNIEEGNRVPAGQSLLAIVDPNLWVVANFKETQLAKMRAGQKVRMTIDAIPGHVFTGRVDSFAPASGNQFALLPADNSTGNFTKIVQRVPVKIVFDPESTKGYEERIRAGLSVLVKVRI
jgi:membrane fusion protein (multidrug efflux system)